MITQEYLKQVLHYDKETGVFTSKISSGRWKVGKVAGHNHIDGYIFIKLKNKIYLAHRLAWMYIYGEFPDCHIDHINGNRSDNRILNLRNATPLQNHGNRREAGKLNKTGFLGVSFVKKFNKYYASIKLKGKSYNLGYFDTAEMAHESYVSAKRKMHEFCTI